MPHGNAPLTELGRLRLARCVVEDGWPLRRAAERFQVSVTTAARWAARYRQQGPAAMVDRSSRPRRCPHQTRPRLVKRVVYLRTKRRWGPARLGPRVGLAASTVHKILRRQGLPRLADVDLATRAELLDVDVDQIAGVLVLVAAHPPAQRQRPPGDRLRLHPHRDR